MPMATKTMEEFIKKLITGLKKSKEGCTDCKIDPSSNGWLNCYKQNIYGSMACKHLEMFNNGDGDELHSKARAVHSSSMLAYNFFHWINKENTFIWGGVTYSEVYFEVKMKTIKGSERCANMDVVLIGKKEDKNHILFIESKFLEYEYAKSKKKELSPKYYESDNWYYTINKKNEEIKWGGILKKWDEMLAMKKKHSYLEGIKQNITHLFGIHSLYKWNEIEKEYEKREISEHLKNIANYEVGFINLIYEPNEKSFNRLHKSFEKYRDTFAEFKESSSNGNLEVIPKWVSYSELWKEMENQIPDDEDNDLKGYLNNRYMQYAWPNEQ